MACTILGKIGGKASIYEESVISGHYLTSTENAMSMELSLLNKNTGELYFYYKPEDVQWWITGFKPLGPGKSVQAKDLQSTVTIDFTGKEQLLEDFKNSPNQGWSFDWNKATFVWD